MPEKSYYFFSIFLGHNVQVYKEFVIILIKMLHGLVQHGNKIKPPLEIVVELECEEKYPELMKFLLGIFFLSFFDNFKSAKKVIC